MRTIKSDWIDSVMSIAIYSSASSILLNFYRYCSSSSYLTRKNSPLDCTGYLMLQDRASALYAQP